MLKTGEPAKEGKRGSKKGGAGDGGMSVITKVIVEF